MFNIVHVKIGVLLDLLLVADMIHAMEYIVKPLEIGTSGTIPCDHIESDPEVRLVQWYKSRNINAFENGDPSLAWWTEGKSGSLANYHMENTTFTLVIDNATFEDEGLYQCSVLRGDLLTRSNYYTRTFIYALPRMDPQITLETALNRFNCTVEHVKPVIYPVFNFGWNPDSTETYVYAVPNEDGTYTTSVCCVLPQNKIASRINCSFSYLHYHREASIGLLDITTDSLMENKPTRVSPMGTSVTFGGDECRAIDHTAIIVLGFVMGLLAVANFIMLSSWWIKFKGKCDRGVQNCNRANESEEKMFQPATANVA